LRTARTTNRDSAKQHRHSGDKFQDRRKKDKIISRLGISPKPCSLEEESAKKKNS
jgi:hypothetical protein